MSELKLCTFCPSSPRLPRGQFRGRALHSRTHLHVKHRCLGLSVYSKTNVQAQDADDATFSHKKLPRVSIQARKKRKKKKKSTYTWTPRTFFPHLITPSSSNNLLRARLWPLSVPVGMYKMECTWRYLGTAGGRPYGEVGVPSVVRVRGSTMGPCMVRRWYVTRSKGPD